jgi:hypothetical protein
MGTVSTRCDVNFVDETKAIQLYFQPGIILLEKQVFKNVIFVFNKI